MARTAAAEGADKQRLFAALVDLIKTHEKGEQRVVHPVTRSSVEGGAATANARLGEEERADQLIAEVKTMTADSPSSTPGSSNCSRPCWTTPSTRSARSSRSCAGN